MSSKKSKKEDGTGGNHARVPMILTFVVIAVALVSVIAIVLVQHNDESPDDPMSQAASIPPKAQIQKDAAAILRESGQAHADPLGLGHLPNKRVAHALGDDTNHG